MSQQLAQSLRDRLAFETANRLGTGRSGDRPTGRWFHVPDWLTGFQNKASLPIGTDVKHFMSYQPKPFAPTKLFPFFRPPISLLHVGPSVPSHSFCLSSSPFLDFVIFPLSLISPSHFISPHPPCSHLCLYSDRAHVLLLFY